MDSSWSHETSVHRHSCKGAHKYGRGHLQTLRLKILLLKHSQNLNKWYFSRMNTWSSWILANAQGFQMARPFPQIPTLYGESLLQYIILVISSTGAPGRFCASCSYFVGCLNRLRDNKTTRFNPFTAYVRFNPGSPCFILVSHRNSSSCTFTDSGARVVNSQSPVYTLLILYKCFLLAPHVVRRWMYIVV